MSEKQFENGFGFDQASVSGVISVVGGDGNTPQNGLIGSQYFLNGAEVPPTSFLVSGYDAQYHTADGMIGPEDGLPYAPALASSLVDMLNLPGTVVLDAFIPDVSDSGCVAKLASDTPWFLVEIDKFLNVEDDQAYIDATALGVSPLANGRYRIALTRLDDASWLASCNGNAVATGTGDNPLPTLEIVTLYVKGSGTKITEFTISTDPVTDEAALQALAALS